MRFVWPIKADYRIVYLDADYRHTIIGRQARDYVWIMARTPSITEEHYQALVERVAQLGYDPARIERVPQRWPETENVGESR
jgi:apolipoprotein D and lipocalin family protein